MNIAERLESPRVVVGVWTLFGCVLAANYVYEGVTYGHGWYLLVALGWLIFGVGLGLRLTGKGAKSKAVGSADSPITVRIKTALPWVGFGIVVAGLALRWT